MLEHTSAGIPIHESCLPIPRCHLSPPTRVYPSEGPACNDNIPKKKKKKKVTTYLRDQDTITCRNAHGEAVTLLVEGAGPDGQDLGLVELLDAGLGEEDAARRLGLGLDALDEDAVQEGREGADGSDRGGLGSSLRVSPFSLCLVPYFRPECPAALPSSCLVLPLPQHCMSSGIVYSS